MNPLIVIIVVAAIIWFLVALPTRRRQRAHAAMQDSLAVGDEVITAGGLHGVVHELGDTELKIEIAPSVVVTLDRRAVAAVAQLEEPLEEQHPEDSPGAS